MTDIRLEYRIAKTHLGKGLIESPNVVVHVHDPYWSYARHLPAEWDFLKSERRTSVAPRLLDNLERMGKTQEMDVGPLRDDQRVSGIVYGNNPLQNMFELIRRYAQRFPDHEFYGKWGGGHHELEGKGFALYVEDEQDARRVLQRLSVLAHEMKIPIAASHQYGILGYQDFVTIDERLRSDVRDVEGFKELLESLSDYPHFFHELFFTDEFIDTSCSRKISLPSRLKMRVKKILTGRTFAPSP
ncbi:MAG: hypothetical protein V1735_02785 [Nanoarchaeota archaeon]